MEQRREAKQNMVFTMISNNYTKCLVQCAIPVAMIFQIMQGYKWCNCENTLRVGKYKRYTRHNGEMDEDEKADADGYQTERRGEDRKKGKESKREGIIAADKTSCFRIKKMNAFSFNTLG